MGPGDALLTVEFSPCRTARSTDRRWTPGSRVGSTGQGGDVGARSHLCPPFGPRPRPARSRRRLQTGRPARPKGRPGVSHLGRVRGLISEHTHISTLTPQDEALGAGAGRVSSWAWGAGGGTGTSAFPPRAPPLSSGAPPTRAGDSGAVASNPALRVTLAVGLVPGAPLVPPAGRLTSETLALHSWVPGTGVPPPAGRATASTAAGGGTRRGPTRPRGPRAGAAWRACALQPTLCPEPLRSAEPGPLVPGRWPEEEGHAGPGPVRAWAPGVKPCPVQAPPTLQATRTRLDSGVAPTGTPVLSGALAVPCRAGGRLTLRLSWVRTQSSSSVHRQGRRPLVWSGEPGEPLVSRSLAAETA